MLCRSDPHGDMALGGVTQMKDTRKLDRSVFSRAPAEGMESTLAFLRCDALRALPVNIV